MTTQQRVAPLVHTGPSTQPRLVSVTTTTRIERVELTPGMRLIDALEVEIERMGANSAQVELLGGSLGSVAYCYPAICEDGSTAVTYSGTRHAITPAQVVAGSATVGFRDGERFMHCHAAWFDAFGALGGGHLWPETFVGETPLEVVIHALADVTMTSTTDDETHMPVFTPGLTRRAEAPGSQERRAVMTRVKPGVEIHQAIGDIMRDAQFSNASVRGSLGSLVGAAMVSADGSVVVDGPATEISLSGAMARQADGEYEGHLSATVIDREGVVRVGKLTTDDNIVAVTFELLVEEMSF